MAQTRRGFLLALAAGTLGIAARSAFGWQGVGGREFDRVGLQLYTVRDAMARGVEATLERVAAIGYREVEFAGYFDHSPERIRSLLERYGLASPSTHVGFDRLGDDWPATLEEAATVGHEYVTVPSIPQQLRGTIDDWKRIAERFNEAGARARDAGLRFAYHNHAFEFSPLDGRVPYEVLLAETDPDTVGFQMDVYWTVRGGHDPLDYFERHAGRFSSLHLKDSEGPPEHRMTDVGDGVIDFRSILAAAPAAGVRHLFVEHDQPADSMATARAGYRHLARLMDAT